ncbi:MAG: M14 family zinc carboxypeptidase [Chloroflexota bacterium]
MAILLATLAYESFANSIEPELVVARVRYETLDDIHKLADYDVWEFNNLAEKYVLVALDRDQIPAVEALGFQVSVDLAKTAVFASNRHPFFGGYRTVPELYADMAALADAHPQLAQIVTYGESHCLTQAGCTTPNGDSWNGVPLQAIRITNSDTPGSSVITNGTITGSTKPVFFLTAATHPREITTPELAMRLADWLLTSYGVDANTTWLVDWHELWIVPVVNPDGHWVVQLGTEPPYNGFPFFQRKNLNDDTNNDGNLDCSIWPPSPNAQYGVDLNRNHSFAWGPPGSSNSRCSAIYRGSHAASEVEIAQLESLIRTLIPDQRGPALTDPAPPDTKGLFISLHSFSRLVLWPWGYTTAPAPNKDGLKAIGDKLATYNGYTSCQPSLCLYGVNGASDDWVYGELGVPAFTFEVGQIFMPSYQSIDSTQWPDNKPAFLYAASIAAAPYQLVHGPDVLDITTAVSPHSNSLTLSATLDDSANGNLPIASAIYTIDAPPWAEGVEALPIEPDDGSFDAPVEEGTAVIDTTSLSLGQHTLYMQAQDSAGNWGPVSAIYFTVEEAPPPYRTLFFPFVSAP